MATLLPEMMDLLAEWIHERDAIRRRRNRGDKPPWTKNPILSNYRFCNVRRMDDKVSQWLLNWHTKYTNRTFQERIVACAAGRLINWPATLSSLPYPAPFDNVQWNALLLKMEGAGNKIFTGAYIINGALGGPKILQITNKILRPMWEARSTAPSSPTSMFEVWSWLRTQQGMGSFMAGQTVADLRHVVPDLPWTDVHTWAPEGPGSIRGVNRLIGRQIDKRLPKTDWLDTLRAAYALARARQTNIFARLELMDFQNCMCEFDKYVRLRNGEGSVRSRYPGGNT